MIITFSAQNFGSIRERQTLSFEADKTTHLEDHYVVNTPGGSRILKLALIYGANASGKTTVIKAMDFLRELVLEPREKKTDELNFNPFLFDPETPSQNSLLQIEFIQEGIRYLYEVEFFKKAIVHETLHYYNPHKATVYKRTTNLSHQFTEISFGNKIKTEKALEKALEANTLWNNTVLGGFLKTNMEQPILQAAIDWFDDYLHPMIYSGTRLKSFVAKKIETGEVRKEDMIHILRKADFNITGISFDRDKEMPEGILKMLKAVGYTDEAIDRMQKDPPKAVQFEHTIESKIYHLPIELESEGTKRYFEFAGLLCMLIGNSMAMPIDELESSLHPDLYLHFLLSFLINAKSSQIIATTHNREILNNKDVFRNDAIWFTDKSETCATELYSLADFDSTVIRDTTNVLNAYKSGKLRGTPNLGDYYIEINT